MLPIWEKECVNVLYNLVILPELTLKTYSTSPIDTIWPGFYLFGPHFLTPAAYLFTLAVKSGQN